MGVTPGLKSFVAAVLGGIGIIPGAALGGFCDWSIGNLCDSLLECQTSVMPLFMESCC